MGEKGIGRLAIAAIGPQVLVLTRAARPNGLHPLVVSFIHWGLFEIPGIDLDSIEIPIEEMPNGELPDRSIIERLVNRIRSNVLELGKKVPRLDRDRIEKDFELAAISPRQIEQAVRDGPILGGTGYGTHFYVRPTSELLADDIDSKDEDTASPLEKMLLGFSNTMMPNRPSPAITAEFRDHHEDGTVDELIGGRTFFTPDEFASADHHIEGNFDEFGQFEGTVAIYRQLPHAHTIQWPRATGRRTECGPFSVKFAYLQGLLKDSRLPPEQWALLSRKLNRIGGLYVYRDGIRILPYGNSDYDFLNIERRRTKSASDWFFSYRRLFGAVEISQAKNPNLVEKAGREGFRANYAYRQFTNILENFCERLAIDFFRPISQFGDDFLTIRQDLNREAELLKRREQSTRARRKDLSDRLNRFFSDLEAGTRSKLADGIRAKIRSRVEAARAIEDPDRAAQLLLEIEAEARHSAAQLAENATIVRPRGVGLSKAQQSDWAAYVKNAEKIEREVVAPLRSDLDAIISETVAAEGYNLDRRRRVLV